MGDSVELFLHLNRPELMNDMIIRDLALKEILLLLPEEVECQFILMKMAM